LPKNQSIFVVKFVRGFAHSTSASKSPNMEPVSCLASGTCMEQVVVVWPNGGRCADRFQLAREANRHAYIETSTGRCEPNAWIRIDSERWRKPKRASRLGGGNIMRAVLTGLSESGQRTNSPMRSRLAPISLRNKPSKARLRIGTKKQGRSIHKGLSLSRAIKTRSPHYRGGFWFWSPCQKVCALLSCQ